MSIYVSVAPHWPGHPTRTTDICVMGPPVITQSAASATISETNHTRNHGVYNHWTLPVSQQHRSNYGCLVKRWYVNLNWISKVHQKILLFYTGPKFRADTDLCSHELIYLVLIFPYTRRPLPLTPSCSPPTCPIFIGPMDLRTWFNNWWAYSSQGEGSSPAAKNYDFYFGSKPFTWDSP